MQDAEETKWDAIVWMIAMFPFIGGAIWMAVCVAIGIPIYLFMLFQSGSGCNPQLLDTICKWVAVVVGCAYFVFVAVLAMTKQWGEQNEN